MGGLERAWTSDHPHDPGCEPYPSLWTTREWEDVLDSCREVHLRDLDLCMSGGSSLGPRTLAASWAEVEELGNRCDHGMRHANLFGRSSEGAFETKELRHLPEELNLALAREHLKAMLKQDKCGEREAPGYF